jgi:hypothetical protein
MKTKRLKMTKADKDLANSMNLEWLKLSNKVLRAFPGSPRQKMLKTKLDKIPQFKNGI